MRWYAVRWSCVVVALAGCYVTVPPQQRPRWYADEQASMFSADCLAARAFVRKSGKQGIGLALQLRSRGDCTVSIERVRLAFARTTVEAPGLAPLALRGRSQLYTWLPVPFDNNAAWNAERDRATLELALRVGGKPVAWTIPMVQR